MNRGEQLFLGSPPKCRGCDTRAWVGAPPSPWPWALQPGSKVLSEH